MVPFAVNLGWTPEQKRCPYCHDQKGAPPADALVIDYIENLVYWRHLDCPKEPPPPPPEQMTLLGKGTG